MALAGMVLHTGISSWEGSVSKSALCVVCGTPVAEGRLSLRCSVAAVLPLHLMVQPKFSLDPGPCASGPWSGIDEAGTWAAEILQYTATLRRAVGSADPSEKCHTA